MEKIKKYNILRVYEIRNEIEKFNQKINNIDSKKLEQLKLKELVKIKLKKIQSTEEIMKSFMKIMMIEKKQSEKDEILSVCLVGYEGSKDNKFTEAIEESLKTLKKKKVYWGIQSDKEEGEREEYFIEYFVKNISKQFDLGMLSILRKSTGVEIKSNKIRKVL